MQSDAPILVVGAGRAGVTLAVALAHAGVAVQLYARRAERRLAVAHWLAQQGLAIPVLAAPEAAHVVLFAVPDRALAAAAHALVAEGAVAHDAQWLHLSGAAPWRALQVPGGPVQLASMHPLAALPDPILLADTAAAMRPLHGATFAIAGTDLAAATARALATRLHGQVATVPEAARTLYHAAAALAANDLVALLHVAEGAAMAAGLTPAQARAGLTHLMQTALDAVARLPPEAPLRHGLTGAVARGDAATLAQHMHALNAHNPAAALIHTELSRELVNVVREGGLGPAALAALDTVLAQSPQRDDEAR